MFFTPKGAKFDGRGQLHGRGMGRVADPEGVKEPVIFRFYSAVIG